MAVRRGKFRAFLKSTPDSVKHEEHSIANSVDGEISVVISVGPRGKRSENVFVNKSKWPWFDLTEEQTVTLRIDSTRKAKKCTFFSLFKFNQCD